MRKLITVLLILALLLPAAAFSESDPVVGTWYLFYDMTASPEFSSFYEGCDQLISVYTFQENGVVMGLGCKVSDGSGDTLYSPVGKWEKSGTEYTYSILGLGSGKLALADDYLLVQVPDSEMYMRFRKFIPFDFYSDYVKR